MIPILRAWSDAASYLDGLRNTVRDDLAPLLRLKGRAPHTVVREACCYLDFLGALYVGTPAGHVDRTTGLATSRYRFVRFIREVMAEIDPSYGPAADLLYLMHRNGTVHSFEPRRVLMPTGHNIGWMLHDGRRIDEVPLIGYRYWVTHQSFVELQAPAGEVSFAVSTRVLLEDLSGAIELFKTGIGGKLERRRRWNETGRVLNSPIVFNGTSYPPLP